MKKSLKTSLKKKHGGFAMTVEVIATMALISVFVSLTLFILQAMNAQRYMNTVVASTATQAARYGGADTAAYKASTGNSTRTLLQDAKSQVDSVLPNSVWHFNISGTPDKITDSNPWVTITATYTLPNVFSSISKVTDTDNTQVDLMGASFLGGTRTITMRVRSLVKAGALLS